MAEPEKKPIAETLGTFSQRLIKEIKRKSEELNNTEISLSDEWWGFMTNHPSTLSDGEPLNPKNAGHHPFQYAYDRLAFLHKNKDHPEKPIDIFDFDGDIEIVLTNNQQLFLERQDEAQSPLRRRRWALIEDIEEENKRKRKVYIQIRDEHLGESDTIELMTFLGILHLIKTCGDYQDIYQFFEKKERKPAFLGTPEKFSQWQERDITVRLDFNQERQSGIDVLIEQIKRARIDDQSFEEFIRQNPEERTPYLLVGNDFSFRLMLFSLVVTKEQIEAIKNLFSEDKQFSDQLNRLKEEFDSRRVPEELRNFIEKYFLLERLYRKKPEDPLTKQIFDPENYQKLGFVRLVDGIRRSDEKERSITAEPVDFWDSSKLNQTLLSDETPLIKNFILALKGKGVRILSVPYLIGHLSAELVTKLIDQKLVRENKIGFVGKVGHGTLDQPRIKIGGLVTATDCYSETEKGSLPFPKSQTSLGIKTNPASLLTVSSVITQTFEDIEQVQQQNPELPVVLDMEQYLILKILKDLELTTKLVSCFYVSDISRKPKKQEGSTLDAERINQSIPSCIGTIAVVQTTLLVLEGLLTE